MSATLIDVAREAGLSLRTVSRVLAGGALAHISPATRDRVLRVAKRLGHRHDLLSASPRSRRSNIVALLVSDIANPWFAQIAFLIGQSLHRHGYCLLLCNSGEDLQCEREYLRLISTRGVDGLILVTLARRKKDVLELLPPGLPLVLLDRPVPGIAASVSSDQDQAASILCDALDRAGVRKIALVAGPRHVVTHRRRAQVCSARFHVIARHEGPAQRETGRQAFIKLQARPDAIVCTNNFLGQGVVDAFAQAKQYPIIACFDEIPMMHLLPVPIICSVQDLPLLADGCVRQLLPQLAGQATKLQPLVLPARAFSNLQFQIRQRHHLPT